MRLSRAPATNIKATLIVAGLATLLIAQAPAPSGSPAAPGAMPPAAGLPQGDPVIAKVNGDEIHVSDLSAAMQGLPPQYRGMPAPTLFPILLDQLVDQKALLDQARKEGLDKDPAVQKQMVRAENQALQNALITRAVGPQVTEVAVKARYDHDVAGKGGDPEVHARHILVTTEDEAKKIIDQLNKGGDFAALAKEHSKDPGSSNGGDLGYFKRGDMLPEFAEAAFSLKANEIDQKPVHTTYGWHVIQVLDIRAAAPPTFEQARDQLRQQMIQEGVQKVLADAKAGAAIEMFNLDGTPRTATDTAEPPPATPPSGGIVPQPRR